VRLESRTCPRRSQLCLHRHRVSQCANSISDCLCIYAAARQHDDRSVDTVASLVLSLSLSVYRHGIQTHRQAGRSEHLPVLDRCQEEHVSRLAVGRLQASGADGKETAEECAEHAELLKQKDRGGKVTSVQSSAKRIFLVRLPKMSLLPGPILAFVAWTNDQSPDSAFSHSEKPRWDCFVLAGNRINRFRCHRSILP